MNSIKELEAFDHLPDSARVRIVPVEGGLPPERAKAVLAVLEELLQQWKGNGAIASGSVAPVAGGYFIIYAYDSAAGDVSGCTKDALTHAILAMEQMLGRRLINAPRLAVAQDGRVEFMNNMEFRERRAAGKITGDTIVYDHLVSDLGAVRTGKFETTVDESWYARIK